MMRFVLLTFAFLGWAFYTLSGGADYQPKEGSRQAEAIKNRAAPETRLARAPVNPGLPTPAISDDTPASRDRIEIAGLSSGFVTQAASAGTDAAEIMPQQAVATDSEQESQNARIASLTLAEPAAFAQAAGFAPTSESTGQTETAQARDLRRIRGTSVNMRAGPGTGYGVLNRVTRGTEVEVLESYQQGWLRLRVIDSESTGWVAASLVSAGQG